MLKLYIYGYLNQVQSSRRLEREAGRNVEVMWLTGKLAPDFKTIADFRRDQGIAIQAICRRFVLLCRNLGLIAGGTVAVDGSRFRAVNARDRNFTLVTIRRRMEQVDASIARYLGMLDTADRQEGEAVELRTARLTTRLDELRRQMRELEAMEQAVAASPDGQISLTDPDARAMASAGRQVLAEARQSQARQLLMSIPGVVAITATAFTSAIEDPANFEKSRSVGAWIGLTTRRYQSGEVGLTDCALILTKAYTSRRYRVMLMCVGDADDLASRRLSFGVATASLAALHRLSHRAARVEI